MIGIIGRSLLRCRCFLRETKGAAAVEFAILSSAFLLILGGVLDFGHAWTVQQIITNASREGARYGVAFQQTTSATRIAPSSLSPNIHDYVINNYIAQTLASGLSPNVTITGTGYSSGTKGQPVRVTVTATKSWFMLGSFISSLPTTLTATTTMLCE